MNAMPPERGDVFSPFIEPAARQFCGTVNERMSSDTNLRFGTNGSLSVEIGGDRRGVWFNQETGEHGGVLDLLRTYGRLEKPAALDWLRAQGAPIEPKRGGGKIVATYDYRAADGSVLYQVVRFDPKDFRQRRPNGCGGWIWNLKGIERIPYRLPDLVDAFPGDPVFIVEGEKDVDALIGLGLVATCNAGGAAKPGESSKWPSIFASYFHGRDVVVIPDNDEAGELHATAVAMNLTGLTGSAASVKVLRLPGLPPKGDVSDWISAGGDAARLRTLTTSAPLFERTAEGANTSSGQRRLTPINPTALAGLAIPQRHWIVEDWLPAAAVTLHYAAGGEGKTLLAQQLMTATAIGDPWLGLATKRCRSFGMFCEDDADELHRRQHDINRMMGCDYQDLEAMRWACPVGDDNALVRFEADGKPVTTPRFDELLAAAEEHGAELIVIDTAADTFCGSENDRAQVSAYVKTVLGRVARQLQAAVLLNAHPSKSSLAAGASGLDSGSTAWTGSARSRWSLETPKGDDGQPIDHNQRTLRRTKANYAGRGNEIKLRWAEGSFSSAEPDSGFDRVASENRCRDKFLDLLDRMLEQGVSLSHSNHSGNYAPKKMAAWPNNGAYTKREFERAMNALFEAGQIHFTPYGKPSDRTFRIERCPDGDGS